MFNPEAIPVKEIFRSVQGEGPFAGEPATFLRLAGCNVGCKFCDEKKSWSPNVDDISYAALLAEISKYPIDLIVVTGGEPFQYSGLIDLLERLGMDLRARIQIETSGIGPDAAEDIGEFSDRVTVVFSPKLSEVADDLHNHMQYTKEPFKSLHLQSNVFFKLVVRDERDFLRFLAAFPDLDRAKNKVYVNPIVDPRSPEYSVPRSFTALVNSVVLGEVYSPSLRRNLRFGVQMHKIFSLR